MNYQIRNKINNDLSIVEQIFVNRGIPRTEVSHYLDTSVMDVLDPAQIDNIKEGAQMLIRHIKNNDKVFIQIDSDCDGFTSSAVLLNYLNRLFPAFTQHNITYRVQDGKQHGLILDHIPKSVKLVIAPDSSSNDYEIHKALRDQGIDVLVIDHHEAEKVSSYACVINNQLCDYPNKTLSGVGMVYKFCSYIDKLLNKDIATEFLDLVAVGIVGDVMDLREFETKYLVSAGCANVRNPHIKSRMASNDFCFKGTLTPFNIAFYVAPFLNAVNRSGTFTEKTLVFESLLDYKAYEQVPSTKRGAKGELKTLVEQAIRTSNNIKNRQSKVEETSSKLVEDLIAKGKLLNNKILVVPIPMTELLDQNLIGLIANQIASKYQKPTLILNERVHGDEIIWEGSGRNFANSPLKDFKAFLQESGLFEYSEGHGNAFGAGITPENLPKFIEYANNKLADFNFEPQYLVDFIFDRSNPTTLKYAILEIGALKKHWGQGVEEPLVVIKDIKITKDNLTLYEKGPTLKITIPGEDGITLTKFRSSEDEYEALYTDSGCVTINVIGTCEINSWNGYCYPQITIKDYEIVDKQNYYF